MGKLLVYHKTVHSIMAGKLWQCYWPFVGEYTSGFPHKGNFDVFSVVNLKKVLNIRLANRNICLQRLQPCTSKIPYYFHIIRIAQYRLLNELQYPTCPIINEPNFTLLSEIWMTFWNSNWYNLILIKLQIFFETAFHTNMQIFGVMLGIPRFVTAETPFTNTN